jgi:putative endonuclease
MSKTHYIYILQCSDDSYYCGYTVDVARRVQEHNGLGETKVSRAAGAKYTRPRRPVKLVYQEKFKTRSAATIRESEIKKLSRLEKQVLIDSA